MEPRFAEQDGNAMPFVRAWKKFKDRVDWLLSVFTYHEFCSFEKFTEAMYRPTDPASLGVCRALFGLCMVIDVVEERGLGHVDVKWGDPDTCYFPLIHGLRPLALPWMVLVYALMWLGAFGIMLGYRFKIACGLFVLPYYYLFLLDKSYWNNHSFLYGIVTLLLWVGGANRYCALDAKREKDKTVPYWNYFIVKFQFFALYFIAGLKKSSSEWLTGYAMANLSDHWLFNPFKIFLTTAQTDFLIVHWFGFIFDLSVGFFMLYDITRIPAMVFCTAFHLMNSRLFSIGMFPYVCLATMPLFCHVDWPRKFIRDSSNNGGEKEEEASPGGCRKKKKISRKQKCVVAALLLHMAVQLFLPYSHFITKGYNNWVPGLYGYSMDMMIHAWDTSLVVIKVRDNESKKERYLEPGIWTLNDRWVKHGDMVRQYAFCIQDNLEKMKVRSPHGNSTWSNLSSNLSIFMDIWCSLNGRFHQRLFDSSVDLLTVDWHPLKPISYVIPLLDQLTSYRAQLNSIQQQVFAWSNYTDVLFMADFPGMRLENYVAEELTNVSISVLEGEVIYRDYDGDSSSTSWTIGKGGSLAISSGRFHQVETTSPHPACYMYTFANRTKQQLADRGIEEPPRTKEAFPILKEIKYRIYAIGRAIGNIFNALLHLAFDVPMLRRVPLNLI
ncbi:vitamin K-dependent gamma-carboxylase isoform X2 [Phymastichus coffea]|uniref:vitamin K-dependent gamma-carboxylase isoform X2 n=1 Tax=Phymastichus coffea TaxID=108790 RepID=UPI00273AD25A|nr:vitamin K-dependent gamma-carboxylase isoform X2 [Phymastichus coffea]